jgi:hypothetical protein
MCAKNGSRFMKSKSPRRRSENVLDLFWVNPVAVRESINGDQSDE